jgi:hypothetical protein
LHLLKIFDSVYKPKLQCEWSYVSQASIGDAMESPGQSGM